MAGIFQQAINLVSFVLAASFTFILAVVAAFGFLLTRNGGYQVQRFFGKMWIRLMAIDVTLIVENGAVPHGGVFAPNHSSWFDIPIMASLPVNIKWISKKEVKRIPLVGWTMQAGGFYFVSRDRKGGDVNVMKEVEEGLKRGETVVIFPEGTRTRTGDLLPLKKGAFRVALGARAPIYPIAISGTRKIVPPGKGFPRTRGHKVVVRIGGAVYISPQLPLEDQMESFRSRLVNQLEANEKS